MSAKALTAEDAAADLEADENDVRRAVTTWDDCDIAALVEDGGDVGPVTGLGRVVDINDLDAAPFVLVKVALR